LKKRLKHGHFPLFYPAALTKAIRLLFKNERVF